MEKLIALYESWHGSKPSRTETIAAGGSNRQYYRIVDGQGKSVIGVIGTSRDENHAFIYLTRHFTRRQLPVPQIGPGGCSALQGWLQCTAGAVAVHCGDGCSALHLRWAKLAPKSSVLFWTREKGGETRPIRVTAAPPDLSTEPKFRLEPYSCRAYIIKAVSLCFIRYSLFL